ncbi:MAG: hypothetical protein LHV69_06800 [Elusimicrobia bacterium]|nr:hypothetical protein [Candidatus Obscuribacterium magneticum]
MIRIKFFLASFCICLIFIGGVGRQTVKAAQTDFFLVLEEGTPFVEWTRSLEKSGTRIRQRVPPRIIIASFPESSQPSDFKGVMSAYSGPVSIESLKGFGPSAVAAGLQWNRNLVGGAQKEGRHAFGTMSAQVAQESLPSPKKITLSLRPDTVFVSWQPVEGALFYQVHLLTDPTVNIPGFQSATDRPDILLPLPEGDGPRRIILRVRAGDQLVHEGNTIELKGAWSETSLTVPAFKPTETLSPPQPTSPVDGYESEGLLVILEWTKKEGEKVRLQLAPKESFTPTLLDQIIEAGEFTVPSSLLAVGQTVHWRIKVWGDKSSPWSKIRRFKTASPTSIPNDMLINPEAPK